MEPHKFGGDVMLRRASVLPAAQLRVVPTYIPITAGICDTRNRGQGSVCTAAILSRSCPLWVLSGHGGSNLRCLLYPQQRTLIGGSGMSASLIGRLGSSVFRL